MHLFFFIFLQTEKYVKSNNAVDFDIIQRIRLEYTIITCVSFVLNPWIYLVSQPNEQVVPWLKNLLQNLKVAMSFCRKRIIRLFRYNLLSSTSGHNIFYEFMLYFEHKRHQGSPYYVICQRII